METPEREADVTTVPVPMDDGIRLPHTHIHICRLMTFFAMIKSSALIRSKIDLELSTIAAFI
jgi:hypothetical protein